MGAPPSLMSITTAALHLRKLQNITSDLEAEK